MLIDIVYMIFGVSLILVVSIVLKKREVRLRKKIYDNSEDASKYETMVGSTKARISRDITRIKRKSGKQTNEIKETNN